MTDTRPDVAETAASAAIGRPRPLLSLLAALVVIAAGVVGAILLWPENGADELSDSPPWGLTDIEMPQTEAEVVAVLEKMPEIDGRRPIFDREIGVVTYEGTDAEAPDVYRSIWAAPADEPPESFADVIAQAVADAEQSDTVTIEAQSLDATGDLVWAVVSDAETSDGIPAFSVMWAEPDGSWLFKANGDTADFRLELVRAFIEAARS